MDTVARFLLRFAYSFPFMLSMAVFVLDMKTAIEEEIQKRRK